MGSVRYRFLLSPRWLLGHVAVVAIAVLFVNLGVWQLRRLDERREANALITERLAAPERPLDEVLAVDGGDPRALAYRRVWVTGRYRPAEEVLISPRSHNEEPGHHVVTPLVTDGGRAVLVDRGWVPFPLDDPPVSRAAPPAGAVTVKGVLLPTETAHRYGSRQAGGPRLTFLSAVDVGRLQPQVSEPLHPFSLLLGTQRPPNPGELPRTPPLPDLTEGPHLSYAIQWFAFTLIGLVGYPLLIRKSLRAGLEAPAGEPEPVAASPGPSG